MSLKQLVSVFPLDILKLNNVFSLADLQEKTSLMRSSVIIAMVMLLKAHLKTLYSLSEE